MTDKFRINPMKNYVWLTGIITSSIALFSVNALADDAATIFGDTSGTLITYDNASGAYPVVSAILTAPGTVDGYTYSRYVFLAEDSTGSLDIFGLPTGSAYVPTVGDAIELSGTYSPFDSIPEVGTLTSITLQSQGNGVSTPAVTTIPTILGLAQTPTLPLGYGENLLTLDDVSLYTDAAGTVPVSGDFPTHANGTYYVKDGSGNIMEMYFWASSYSVAGALGGTAIPTGDVDITGFLSVSGGVAQITPFSITSVPEPTTLALSGVGALLALAFRRRKS
jgi:PEP-CTERM motif